MSKLELPNPSYKPPKNKLCYVLSPQSVILPVKMTPIHKVWSWSLGGQGVILTGAGMFKTLIFIA